MNSKKQKVLEVLFLFFSSLTPLLWLSDSEVILGHDSGFRILYQDHLRNLFFSWNPIYGFGYDWSITKGFLIAQLPETIFSVITHSLQWGQRISFVFWFFIMCVSMYTLVNNIFNKKEYWITRLFSSLFYVYNFFILQAWFIVERAKFSLYAALPLSFLILYKTMTKRVSLTTGSILFGLVFFFLNGGSSPPLYGAVLLVLGVSFITISVFLFLKNKSISSFIYPLKVLFCFSFTFLLFNAYWILPQVSLVKNTYKSSLGSFGGIQGILNWEGVVSKYASIPNLIRFQGIPDWYDNPGHPYAHAYIENVFLIFVSFLPISIIVAGLYFYREKEYRKVIYLLLILFLIGFVFTAGSHPPFGALYIYFIKYIPGFAIFRSAFYKFGPALWMSASVLVGFSLNTILLQLAGKRKRVYSFFGWCFVIGLLLYHYPFFSGRFFMWNDPFSTKVTLPSYVATISEYLNREKETSRVLLAPRFDPASQADSYTWGYWSLDALPFLSTNKSIVSNKDGSPYIVNILYKSLEQDTKSFLKVAATMGIRYILWRNDALYMDKRTTGEDFIAQLHDLEKNAEIEGEVKQGKWRLIKLADSHYTPIVYSPTSFVLLNDINTITSILAKKDDHRFAFVSRESLFHKNEKITSFLEEEYVSAECVLCYQDSLTLLQEDIVLPYARILPGGIFYPIVELQERELFKKATTNDKKIDVYLSLSSKRLAEVEALYRNKNESTYSLAERSLLRYEEYINKVTSLLDSLPEEQKNVYSIKVLAFLGSHKLYMERIYKDAYLLGDEFSDQLALITTTIHMIEKQTWMSVSPIHKKFLLSIADAGTYSIFDKDPNINKMLVDGKDVPVEGSFTLTQGKHRVEVYYNPANFTFTQQMNEKVELPYEATRRVRLPQLEKNKQYLIEINYLLRKGKDPLLHIIERKKEKSSIKHVRISLSENGRKGFRYMQSGDVDEAYIEFTGSASNEETLFEITKLAWERLDNTELTFTAKEAALPLSEPKISFAKINPTMFYLTVENATGPYLLNFGENFSPGWKAFFVEKSDRKGALIKSYFPDNLKEVKKEKNTLLLSIRNASSQQIPESNHYLSNSYSNMWLMEKTGTYDIVIEYVPQRTVYSGIALSVISVGIALGYLYKKYYEKN